MSAFKQEELNRRLKNPNFVELVQKYWKTESSTFQSIDRIDIDSIIFDYPKAQEDENMDDIIEIIDMDLDLENEHENDIFSIQFDDNQSYSAWDEWHLQELRKAIRDEIAIEFPRLPPQLKLKRVY